VLTPEGFEIVTIPPWACFCIMEPSAIYDVMLEPKDSPYTVDVNVSHSVAPNEADRFQIAVASTCSADYLIRSSIEVDGKVVHETKPMEVPVRFLRLLPNFGYRDGLPVELEDADLLRMSRTKAQYEEEMSRFMKQFEDLMKRHKAKS